MNKFILMGNLTRDPEQRSGKTDTIICSFSMAVRRRQKREGELDADFFNLVAFGKTAEVILKYCKKGSRLLVSGRIQQQAYKDKTGNIVHGYSFIVEEIDFAGNNQAAQQNQQPAPARQDPPARQAPAQQQEDFTPYYDDLPFI